MADLISNQILSGVQAYEQALDLVIHRARKTLFIFDQDLSQGAYNTVARTEMLQKFLANQGQLTLILHDSSFFLKHCPRLTELLQTYHHAMQVYLTNDDVQHVQEAFVVADGAAYARRFHIDHARFKFSLDDWETVSELTMKFDALLGGSAHSVSISVLGL